MRTTSKAFKDQVQTHIKDILCTDYTVELEYQLKNTVEAFHSWYGAYEQKRTPNVYSAYIEWFLGLPSEISVEYRHYAIEDIIISWFQNLGETYKEPKDEQKTYDLYYHLVTREFYALCRKHDIQP